MKTLYVLALLTCSVVLSESRLNPLSDDFINYINSKQNTWKAGRNFDTNTPMHEIRKLLGTIKTDPSLKTSKTFVHSEDIDIPESFDAREQWPECNNVINQIPDQSACGSCWAVAAASAMSDRRCIKSNGTLQVPVSADDLLSCCSECGYGCDGGYIESAWGYWINKGIVTGGAYNSSEGCKSYSLEPCEHHIDGDRKSCDGLNFNTPPCKKECDNPQLSFEKELTLGDDRPHQFLGEKNIQREILQNGPVEAGFTVYEDFVNYKSGVYQYTAGEYLGGHAVRVLGWGTENDTPYWLIANSWNNDWGQKGYFKIIRGRNEVDIESEIYAAPPKL